MGSIIRARCAVCGEVELRPEQVELVECSVPEWSSYAFECPLCHTSTRKQATDEIVELLRSAGVVCRTWHVPAEVLEDHHGPVFGEADVTRFVELLDDDDAVRRSLARANHPSGRHRRP